MNCFEKKISIHLHVQYIPCKVGELTFLPICYAFLTIMTITHFTRCSEAGVRFLIVVENISNF
jgi:hypothetical protein